MGKELSFRPIALKDVTMELLKKMAIMNLRYARRSHDFQIGPDSFLDIIRRCSVAPDAVPYQFWLLMDSGEPVGYALTEFLPGDRGLEMNIAQAYIEEGYRANGVQKLTIDKFEEFARSKGCAYITSVTRRGNPAAYIRWMGRCGFQKRLVMCEKELKAEAKHG